MKATLIDNGKIRYADSLRQQVCLFETALECKKNHKEILSTLIFNEHYPVVTLGKHADKRNILIPRELLMNQGIDVFEIQRGGDATYHGPGQWTIYPIFDLEALGIGLRQYVENLEEVAIRVASKYNVVGKRIHGASGVWIDDSKGLRKLCAIGIQASRYITMHGIAFNVCTPPNAFSIINPCGFSDRGVTNLCLESGQEISMTQAKSDLCDAFSKVFGISFEEIAKSN